MIRFIDMGSQVYLDDVDVQHSFAFIDTFTDKFLEFNGSVYWDSYADFVEDFQDSINQGGTARRASNFWTRINGLIPDEIKNIIDSTAADSKSYIAGQEIAFTIYLQNGYCVTISSVDGLSLTHARLVQVKIARINYRNLKLDAKLSDNAWIELTPEELIICLNTVLTFNEQTDLPQAEYELRHNLHRTL